MKTVFIKGTVIDATGAPARPDCTVTVENGRIASVEEGAPAPDAGEDVRVIDLSGKYLLPGFWEVHTHLGDLIPDPHNYLETEDLQDYTIRAGRNAMDALRAGITGIRTVGDSSFVDVAWKRAFAMGVMAGPRLFVSTRAISMTGGHGHGTLGALEADGPWDIVKSARENMKRGADWVKLMVTGGIMTAGQTMGEAQLTIDEIRAGVNVTHARGKRVAVHAWGTEGVKRSLHAGVDSVEHGLLDDEAVELFLEKGAFYVPTICCTQDDDFIDELPQYQIDKARAAQSIHREGLQKAIKAGVKIAVGSDSTPINEFNKRELEFLVACGMSPMDTIIAATRTSADLCGVLGDVGTIEVGKLADLVVLDEDPLKDISAARKVAMVFKEGKRIALETDEATTDYMELYC